MTSDEELEWLLEYAESGGHLILGPRTAYADDEARARAEVAPARLHEAAGVWYDEFSNIGSDLAVVASPQPPGGLPALALGRGATATRWVDGLVATTATVLATYEDRHFRRWPAITTHSYGAGRITVVGTIPSLDLAEQLFRWIDDLRAAVNPWRPQSESVTVTSATNGRGERVHFAHNWSWENATLTIPAPAVDVLTQEELPVGHALQLKPWDVRVLREAPFRWLSCAGQLGRVMTLMPSWTRSGSSPSRFWSACLRWYFARRESAGQRRVGLVPPRPRCGR